MPTKWLQPYCAEADTEDEPLPYERLEYAPITIPAPVQVAACPLKTSSSTMRGPQERAAGDLAHTADQCVVANRVAEDKHISHKDDDGTSTSEVWQDAAKPDTPVSKTPVNEWRNERASVVQNTDSKHHPMFNIESYSIHDREAALAYRDRVRKLEEKSKDGSSNAIRSYLEKSRTTVGWKGLINDPNIDGNFLINKGLKPSKRLFMVLTQERSSSDSANAPQDLFSHVRRFVITAERDGHLIGLPINSYNGHGLSRKKLSEREEQAHTVIYASDKQRCSVEALKVRSDEPMRELDDLWGGAQRNQAEVAGQKTYGDTNIGGNATAHLGDQNYYNYFTFGNEYGNSGQYIARAWYDNIHACMSQSGCGTEFDTNTSPPWSDPMQIMGGMLNNFVNLLGSTVNQILSNTMSSVIPLLVTQMQAVHGWKF